MASSNFHHRVNQKAGEMKALCISIAFFTLLVGVAGCSSPSITNPISPESKSASATTSVPTSTPTPTLPPSPTSAPSISSILAEVSPAVVRVVTDEGMGSGMLIDKAGYVLTNSHVIEGSKSIKVVFANKSEYPASVIGRDEIKDLAILKISAINLPVITIGNSETLTPGDEVIAIGYPLDLKGSATISRGIVSAFRNYEGVDYIQIDASINPGSSGGALINLAGEVVGINVMAIRVSGGMPIEGINFAIAINSAKPIIPKLIAGISVLKPTHEPETRKTYINPVYPYSIEYPSDWAVKDSNKSIVQLLDNQLVGLVGISSSKNSGFQSLRDYVAWGIDWDTKNRKDYLLISSKQITHNGREAWELSYSETLGEDTYLVREVTVSTPSQFYRISGEVLSTSSKDYSLTFDTIIASFRITEITPITPLKVIEDTTLKNLTWKELKDFLLSDNTDKHFYVYPSFTSKNYAEMLQNNAKKSGRRCAVVKIHLNWLDRQTGAQINGVYFLNAFETTDQGIVYIDSTNPRVGAGGDYSGGFTGNAESIAKLEIGKNYNATFIFPDMYDFELVPDNMGVITGIDPLTW